MSDFYLFEGTGVLVVGGFEAGVVGFDAAVFAAALIGTPVVDRA